MKNYLWPLTVSVIWIIIAILGITTFGFNQDFAYSDTEGDIIDIYSVGNISIESIDGTIVEGKPIQVVIDKKYDNLVLSYLGENYSMDNGFTFTQSKNMSFELNFDEDTGSIYLDRNFQYLMGFNTLSLVLLIIAIFNALLIIFNILTNSNNNTKDTSYIYIPFSKHLMNTITRSKVILLSIFGLSFLLLNFIDAIWSFIFSTSDTDIVFGLLLVIVTTVLGSFLYEIKSGNIVFLFDEHTIKVSENNQVIFSEKLEDVLYKETLVRETNRYFSKSYSEMKLRLTSKRENIEGIELQLLPFGIDKFNQIVEKLHSKSPQDIIFSSQNQDSHKPESNNFTLSTRDISNNGNILIGIFIILIMTVLLPILFPIIEISITTLLILPSILLLLIVIVMIKNTKKIGTTNIKLNDQGIWVNEVFYDKKDIKMIAMSNPSEIGIQVRVIDIKTTANRIRLVLKPNTFRDKNTENNLQYLLLFTSLKKEYSDIFRLK